MRKLIIIIPALNEELSIAHVIKTIPSKIKGIDDIKVVVIDDGSDDSTAEIAQSLGADVITHPYNLGLGVAFRRGISRALELDADIVVNIDADGQFDSADIPFLISPILEGKAEFVTASRFKSKDPEYKISFLKEWGISGCPG